MVIYFSLLLSHWWECFPYDRIASIKSDSAYDSCFSISQPRSQSSSAIWDVTSPVKFAYRARFQASSGHSDSANMPGTRLQFSLFSETTYPRERDHHSRTLIFSHFKPIFFSFRISAQRERSTEHLKLKWMDRPYNVKTTSSSLTMLFGGNV